MKSTLIPRSSSVKLYSQLLHAVNASRCNSPDLHFLSKKSMRDCRIVLIANNKADDEDLQDNKNN